MSTHGELLEDDDYNLLVEELPDYLKCPICLCCLNNPYQMPCGQHFCKECILPLLNRGNLCPIDQTQIDLTNTFPDNAVQLQINGLKVRCPNQICDWVGELSDKPDHLKECNRWALSASLSKYQVGCPL